MVFKICSHVIKSALIALAGFGMMGTAGAQAPESRLDAIEASKVLRVCTTGDFKPFTIAAGEGFEGIDIEMARSLAKALGAEVQFVRTKWAELMPDFTAGKCDIAMGGIGITLERQKRAFYSAAVLRGGAAPIARCEDKARLGSVAEIDKPGVRVIANPGGNNERFAKANFKTATVTIHTDNATIFDEIAQNRADVMVTSWIEGAIQSRLNPALCVINPDKPLTFSEMGYLLPRGDLVFKAFVDQWLHMSKSNGEYERISRKYF